MKVEKPRIMDTGRRKGEVICDDCPLDEENNTDLRGTGVCAGWRGSDGKNCPTLKTYAEAVTLADKAIAAKEGR
jgi:hypothetical protein